VNLVDSPFQQALDFIYSFIDYERFVGARVGHNWETARVASLLARLGNPHLKAKTVHIAGTKGKGSVAAMVSSVLTHAGFRTGLFTSPHLHLYNERIRVDGKYISNEDIVRLVERLKPEVEAVNEGRQPDQRLTTFEVTTALGFMYFAEQNTDFQVVEVGLGGRLDATNVVVPEVCIITSISLDHTDMLGNTIAAIAAEKAGIIKADSVVVSSSQTDEADRVISDTAESRGAQLIRVGKDISCRRIDFDLFRQVLEVNGRLDTYRFTIPLLGRHQMDNAAAAIGAVEILMEKGHRISKENIVEGMAHVSWEGRLQVLNRRPVVVTDGAHNRDSARKLREATEQYFSFSRAILVIGLSSDKDLEGIAAELAPAFRKVIATRSSHPRSMPTEKIAAEFRKHGLKVEEVADFNEAFSNAVAGAGEDDLVCITGSLFIAANAIERAIAAGLKP